jgi:hydrogenase nickel incorporation protein HypB
VTIPVVRKVLERNEAAAAQNRAWFNQRGVLCVNVLGGPGSGKTSLLEALIPHLRPRFRVAVLEGDPATTRDAERIARLGAPVVQLVTDGGCHLRAEQVQRALELPEASGADLLFIENVGNLVCPANFDLGEHLRIVVLSVVEGDDKPSKYAMMFRGARLAVLSKQDLLPLVNFDVEAARRDMRQINPEIEILETDVRTPRGIEAVVAWLHSALAHARSAAVAEAGPRGEVTCPPSTPGRSTT